VTRINSLAAVLERFRAGDCRRRPLTTADVLGAFRRRDGRKTYLALRHRREIEAQREAEAAVRIARRPHLSTGGVRSVREI
jgi:hypothetical protein